MMKDKGRPGFFSMGRRGLLLAVLLAGPVAAGDDVPSGLIAASAGDQVILALPTGGTSVAIRSGPVGWLYPAPAGILFAPDLVNGRTTVINLRRQQVAGVIDGVTMPRFGASSDRYIVIAGNVLVTSYPARAQLEFIEAELDNPWQAIVTPNDGGLLVLQREPPGQGHSTITAVDLQNAKVAFTRPLAGDVTHFTLSPELTLVALADQANNAVILCHGAALTPMMTIDMPGQPIDLVFTGAKHELLVVAMAVGSAQPGQADQGKLLVLEFKDGRKGLRRREKGFLALPGRPVRIACDPWNTRVAVALESNQIVVATARRGRQINIISLPAPPRDVVWCDPGRQGPLLPDWSDEITPEFSLDPDPGKD